jgi:transposase
MGWITMSARDLKRLEVLTEVQAGRRTVASAAVILGVSERQAFRLLARYRDHGGGGLIHQARGRESNRSRGTAVQQYAVELVRTHYRDFGPTLAVEMLLDKHELKVGRETLRQWMIESGLWLSRTQRKILHQPRLRRERLGELIQIDGNEHRWFEQRGEPCTLLVMIDDATSRLMQLRFVPSESTASYFEALRGYLDQHGRPVAFYSDKHSVFRQHKQDAKNGQGMTQFGRALAELHIDIFCANSSQAKGRVERANRTLQDRLVKALRIAGISDMTAGNAFLPAFMEQFNERFAVAPIQRENLHRPLGIAPDRLSDILCHRELRSVSSQLMLSYDRKFILLEPTERARSAAGQYVDVHEFPDGALEVRWQGERLPYTIFDKNQRVRQGAIVDNKRLRHALALVKVQQDLKHEPPKIKTHSERDGYNKKGRTLYGPDYVEKSPPPQAVEICKIAKSGDFAHSHSTHSDGSILSFLSG